MHDGTTAVELLCLGFECILIQAVTIIHSSLVAMWMVIKS